MGRITDLIKEAASSDNRPAIEELLRLCDSIYYTGRPATYRGKKYDLKDLPTDEQYDYYRKEYTPEFKPTDYFKLTSRKGVKEDLIKHDYPMASLSKYTGEEARKLNTIYSRISGKPNSIFKSGKIDGLSVRCYYTNGVLTKALTRHDHEYGLLATDKAALFVTRPDPSFIGEIVVRGEVIMRGDGYKKLGYANRRNGAAGLMGQQKKYTNVKEELSYVVYELTKYAPAPSTPGVKGKEEEEQWPEKMPETQDEQFHLIERLGFETPPHTTDAGDFDPTHMQALLKSWQALLDYDLDGIVVSPNHYKAERSDPPKLKVAFKGQTEGEWTTVISVVPRATRTGNVIPQVYIDQIEVNGAVISTIAGANYNVIGEKGIRIGSRVYVVRSGEVIPFIKEVDNDGVETTPVIPPTICPSCSWKLETVGEQRLLKCPNPACPAKRKGRIEKYVTTIGIVGIGAKRLHPIEEKYSIETIEDLYTLSKEQIEATEGFGDALARSLFSQLRSRIRPITESTLLAAMGLPLIGDETAKLITDHIPITELFGDTPFDKQDLEGIKGIGDRKIEQLMRFHQNGRAILTVLLTHGLSITREHKPPPPIPGKAIGKVEVIALTGTGNHARTYYESAIIGKGWRVVNSISKLTTILVTDSPDASSNKMKKALELGIKIMSYDDFDALISDHSNRAVDNTIDVDPSFLDSSTPPPLSTAPLPSTETPGDRDHDHDDYYESLRQDGIRDAESKNEWPGFSLI